jgi:hypothetical protein
MWSQIPDWEEVTCRRGSESAPVGKSVCPMQSMLQGHCHSRILACGAAYVAAAPFLSLSPFLPTPVGEVHDRSDRRTPQESVNYEFKHTPQQNTER